MPAVTRSCQYVLRSLSHSGFSLGSSQLPFKSKRKSDSINTRAEACKFKYCIDSAHAELQSSVGTNTSDSPAVRSPASRYLSIPIPSVTLRSPNLCSHMWAIDSILWMVSSALGLASVHCFAVVPIVHWHGTTANPLYRPHAGTVPSGHGTSVGWGSAGW